MYRIFCESYENFKNSFSENSCRLEVTKPFELIVDTQQYQQEKQQQSDNYKRLCDLLYYIEKHLEEFPRLKAFLWTLSSREIEGKAYHVAKQEEIEEQAKLVNSFMKLAYWY